jgi:FkbM family methyltransferase
MKELFQFRDGTCDHNVFTSVVELNEYRLPDAFSPDDWILDLGAHIGSFTQACLDRGAGKIIAFEPDHENFELFRRHLAPEIRDGRVEVYPLAVDGYGFTFQRYSGYLITPNDLNTGGGHLTYGSDFRGPSFPIEKRLIVPVIGLNTVFSELQIMQVRLLKMDIEGAERNVLESFGLFDLVDEVCGEYHPSSNGLSREDVFQLLGKSYQEIVVEPHPESTDGLGLFWAKRS